MATPTAGSGSLPTPNTEILAEPLETRLAALYAFLTNASNIDEGNVDYTSADGVVVLRQAQTITGAKTFSTAPIVNDHTVGRIRVYNDSGGAIASGDALYVSGYDTTTGLYEVTKAVVTQANTTTLYASLFADAAISNGAQGNACARRILTGQDTSGLTAGRPVWLSSTAGGWLGARSNFADTDFRAQIVGKVITVNASTGRIEQYAGPIIPYSLSWDI
jgi:hypothetical protein